MDLRFWSEPRPSIHALKHGLDVRYVVEADLQISFPRHREWLLMAGCRQLREVIIMVVRRHCHIAGLPNHHQSDFATIC